jgi:DNA polymerase-1
VASGLISRAAKQVNATHMIVAMDSAAPSWRKVMFPDYKANRTTDTTPWLQAGFEYWSRLGWYVTDCGGFEADDIIATIALRACEHSDVVVLSGDSDLLCLTDLGATILKPENGGVFKAVESADVCAKYNIPSAMLLPDFKALVGEKGDNVPGVPGIGPVKAAWLIKTYGCVGKIITAGATPSCKQSLTVWENREAAQLAIKLVSLSYSAPVVPAQPKDCVFKPH